MNLKNINIVDPCFTKNNIGKSISQYNSYRFKESLKIQNLKISKTYSKT